MRFFCARFNELKRQAYELLSETYGADAMHKAGRMSMAQFRLHVCELTGEVVPNDLVLICMENLVAALRRARDRKGASSCA